MEIQNEIVKTQKRVDLLVHQNEKFRNLLDRALTVTKSTSSKSTAFERECLEIIEEESAHLKDDLSSLSVEEEPDKLRKIESLERLLKVQRDEIETLKAEHAEIKFLLLHPESRNSEWLKNILELDDDVTEANNTSLVEERFRLQRKILNLEKKKAELLLAINDAAIPDNITHFIDKDVEDEDQLTEYEDLRFKMLNLEDERSRLLNDLQCVLNRSRKQIAKEYNHLQSKIVEMELKKSSLKLSLKNPHDQNVTSKELESIFNAFRNVPLNIRDEQSKIERLKADVGGMFCPEGYNLPVYCSIL